MKGGLVPHEILGRQCFWHPHSKWSQNLVSLPSPILNLILDFRGESTGWVLAQGPHLCLTWWISAGRSLSTDYSFLWQIYCSPTPTGMLGFVSLPSLILNLTFGTGLTLAKVTHLQLSPTWRCSHEMTLAASPSFVSPSLLEARPYTLFKFTSITVWNELNGIF